MRTTGAATMRSSLLAADGQQLRCTLFQRQTETGWAVPVAASTVELVFVLRDSRGGTDGARVAISVTPSR